jgi:hypothetical protein
MVRSGNGETSSFRALGRCGQADLSRGCLTSWRRMVGVLGMGAPGLNEARAGRTRDMTRIGVYIRSASGRKEIMFSIGKDRARGRWEARQACRSASFDGDQNSKRRSWLDRRLKIGNGD